MEDWSAYRSFLGVLRGGSLSGAARALGLTQPTIGRHIAALEQELGTALFVRSVRGLAPTDAALNIGGHAEAIEAAIEAARRTASAPSDIAAGTVRITASEIVGGEVLPGILADLKRRHDGLAFEVSLSNETADLMRRDADIAVRMVKPAQGALISAPAGRVKLGLFARRDYLKRCGTPKTLAELSRHALIGFDRETPFVMAVKRQLKMDRAALSLRSDSDLAQLSAIRAGFGLGICQIPLAQRPGDLVHVLEDQISFTLNIWIAMHEDLKRVRRMRVVFDHLVEAMRSYARS